MDLDAVRQRLDRLHASEALAVDRFDHEGNAVERMVVLPSAFNPPTGAPRPRADQTGTEVSAPPPGAQT